MRKRIALAAVLLVSQVACTAGEKSSSESHDEAGIVAIELSTSAGKIAVELDLDNAPLTAGNFLKLVDTGNLNGATFYRTVSPANDNGSPPISVIQGGIGEASASFATIEHETTQSTGLLHVNGAISMARGDVGTASTEFFICIGDQPALDFGGTRNADGQGFAVFGQVTEGMDVVRAIHDTPATAQVEDDYFKGQIFAEPVGIESVRRVQKPAN